MRNRNEEKRLSRNGFQTPRNEVKARDLSVFTSQCELSSSPLFKEIWEKSRNKPCYDCMCLPCKLLDQFKMEDQMKGG
jgi:hypothetical protein